jgi:hypothetical protein
MGNGDGGGDTQKSFTIEQKIYYCIFVYCMSYFEKGV